MTLLDTLSPKIRLLINIVLGLILVGILLWAINMWIPMAGSIKAILNFVVVIGTCVLILQAVGIWQYIVRLWNNLVERAQHPQ